MKNTAIFSLILLFGLAACQPAEQAEEAPQGLKEKRALLVTKRAELQTLTNEIEQLEAEIAELDPNAAANERLVTTMPISRRDFQRFAEMQGSVVPAESAAAAAEVPGRIVKLYVEEGDRVRANQLIAELDLEQLNKQIAEVDKSLELAREVFARQKRLWDQNIGSEIQYLEAKNSVERLEKSKETLDFQLSKSKVYAPITGVVDQVMMESGELAMTGAPIVNILSTGRLKVEVDLPENFLQNVSRGDRVTVQYPALGISQEARIGLIGSTIDPSNRTFEVEINVGNPGGKLKPNLLATVLIMDYEEKDVVVVPLNLVQEEVGGRKFVMTVDYQDDGTPVSRKVYVQTGESYDGNVVITNGLSGEEILIDKGARGLADEEIIQIQTPKTVSTNG